MDLNWLERAVKMARNLEEAEARIEELESFVEKIKYLTEHHDVIACTNGNRYASVSPKKIHDELKRIGELKED